MVYLKKGGKKKGLERMLVDRRERRRTGRNCILDCQLCKYWVTWCLHLEFIIRFVYQSSWYWQWPVQSTWRGLKFREWGLQCISTLHITKSNTAFQNHSFILNIAQLSPAKESLIRPRWPKAKPPRCWSGMWGRKTRLRLVHTFTLRKVAKFTRLNHTEVLKMLPELQV